MMMFVLRHARQLLRSEDAEALLACERWQRDYQKHGITDPLLTPWWAIAAADLQPRQAKDILLQAFQRFQGEYSFDADNRAELAVALWRTQGLTQSRFLIDWFYRERPQRGQFAHCRASFLRAIAAERSPENRKLFAGLMREPGFEALDWQSLEEMAKVVNGWTKKPVVSREELASASHPFGPGHFYWMQAEALLQHPKETRQLMEKLSAWRKALKASVAEWDE